MRNSRFLGKIAVFAELAKFKVTLLVTFTTAAGYFLFSSFFTLQLIFAVVGIFLLASGSAALNQVQEKKIDKIMPRTKNRPIPSGKIKPVTAIIFSFVLILSGSLILYSGAGIIPLLLGLFTLFWYNGIYTYLKRITAFAVVPGSIVGAVPPLVGWTAAGGVINDFEILSLAFYLFIWQIPHFWLLLIMYGKDYEMAGLPTLSGIFTTAQIKRVTFMWIFATLVCAVLFSLFNHFLLWNLLLIIISSLLFFIYGFLQIFKKDDFPVKRLFIFINLFTLLVLIISIINSLNISL